MNASGWILGLCVGANLALIAAALQRWGAAEIRQTPGEVVFLTAAGAGWLLLSMLLFSWFGVSVRDDVIERKNRAALTALGCAIMGAGLLYIGGSMGEGPSYWNNVFSAGIAATAWLALWALVEKCGGVSMSVAEERDLASGIRMGGFLLAIALVLGRAVAGDWHSAADTVRDFIHDGWFGALVAAIAVAVERYARPSRRRPVPSCMLFGLAPGLGYLGLAALWLWHLGPWEGMIR